MFTVRFGSISVASPVFCAIRFVLGWYHLFVLCGSVQFGLFGVRLACSSVRFGSVRFVLLSIDVA
jgi:hypothetical protein